MRTRPLIALLAATSVLAGCGGGDPDLVVYSGRAEPLIKPFIEEFAERENLEVDVRYGDTADIVGTVLEEGEKTRADVVIGQDVAALEKLRSEGLLQVNPTLPKLDTPLRADDGSWTGLSGRARVLIVREGAERPTSVFDLVEPRYRGKIAAPATSNVSFRDFVTAVRVKKGDDFAREFLEGLKANDLAVLASHSDVRNAVGEGEFDIGLVNHYYVELEKKEGSAVEAVYTDQEPGGFGTFLNAASAGITKATDRTDIARRFMDYLVEPEVQRRFARANFEYPLAAGIPAAPGVKPLEEVKLTSVSPERLTAETDATEELFAEVGLGD